MRLLAIIMLAACSTRCTGCGDNARPAPDARDYIHPLCECDDAICKATGGPCVCPGSSVECTPRVRLLRD
jgi:hypothetical protein